jgi:hypothetical protein
MAIPQSLLVRLLTTPNLPAIVPRLQPEVLHRVIQTCGLEDCAELVALTTPAQLGRVLDADVWRVRARGGGETFDADRFGIWIDVMMQAGAATAAEKLVGLDIDLVVEGLSRHAAVFDYAAVAGYATLDGEYVRARERRGEQAVEIGGYRIEAKRLSAWDAIVQLLAFLETEQSTYFHRAMRACVWLSNGAREHDGFHDLLQDPEQHLFDLAVERDARREQLGYVAPAEAHAFLRGARHTPLSADRQPESSAARTYFRGIRETESSGDAGTQPDTDAPPLDATQTEERQVAAFVEVLRDAGVLAPQPRALLGAGDGAAASRLGSIEAHADRHPEAAGELAYLANIMIAACTIQGRAFTIREAADAAAATCNLGLENWPPQWRSQSLIAAFQTGWTLLHRDVCLHAANALVESLEKIDGLDRETWLQVETLRRALARHAADGEPWRIGDTLDVLVVLDAAAWAALRALLDECPVLHAAVTAAGTGAHRVDPAQFEFISCNSEIEAVRAFLGSLPERLSS